MKTIGPYTTALFAGRQFQSCNVFNFSLLDGTQLYYSAGDVGIYLNTSASNVDVESWWANQTFLAGGSTGPYFDREDNKFKGHWKRGVEVDTFQLDVMPGTSTVEGEPFLSFIRQGGFDGAEITVYGAYWPKTNFWQPVITPTGTIIKFVGRVAQVDAGRSIATFTINSHLELLNMNMPRNLWQQSCVNTLYDASCTLSATSFQTEAIDAGGSTQISINVTNLVQASGYYSLGTLTGLTGANAGIARGISSYTLGSPSSIFLMQPFPNVPNIGDTYNAAAGCNKLQATCQNKFSNLVNFRGFPDVPVSETAV